MSDHEPPRVFVSYSHDTPEHSDSVQRFATFLRARVGLDVHLDRWHDVERVDWSLWAMEHLTKADFVLVIASPEYKRRADGAAPPHEGRGAQFEAAILRNNATRDLRGETRRVLPVVLPGCSIEDIPTFLNAYSTTRYEIAEYSDAGVAELLAAITGHGQYPMPERGEWRDGDTTSASTPLTRLPWQAHSQGVRAGDALLDGVRYADAIVLRRPSAGGTGGFVEVVLGGRYQRFTSVACVLDDAAEPFQVGDFAVLVDGERRWVSRAALGKPRTVDIDVTGALRLRLEMSRTGRAPELAWGDPTVR
jgi:hypothetical protein